MTTGNATSYYYLGDRLVAKKTATTLNYIHQDHLTGTAVVTSDSGTLAGSTRYYPFGGTRSSTGTMGTDKLFTGQRLDDTGLYYYGARYYDPAIGRFISADSIVQDFANPQAFSRYSYVLNNPLKYTDPSGSLAIGFPRNTFYNLGGGGSQVKPPTPPAPPKPQDPTPKPPAPTPPPKTGPSGSGGGDKNDRENDWEDDGATGRGTQPDLPIERDTGNSETIIMCDAIALIGDAISIFPHPVTSIGGYSVSAVAGYLSWALTFDEWEEGRVSDRDLAVASTNFMFGLYPVYGIIPAAVQLLYDFTRYEGWLP